MPQLNILPPLHLMALWRSEGFVPQEVRAMADSWVAERIQYHRPYVSNGLIVSHPKTGKEIVEMYDASPGYVFLVLHRAGIHKNKKEL